MLPLLLQSVSARARAGYTGYAALATPAAEPTSWMAIALAESSDMDVACLLGDKLEQWQASDGSVGVTPDQRRPAWTTALAMIAWSLLDRVGQHNRYAAPIQRAIDWSLAAHGKPAPRKRQIGHDTTLVGWSWADDTHSWLEPTAFFVRALELVGRDDHPRTREGRRLLIDRLLPAGGANYGNTIVLGQELLPHLQPSAIAAWALGSALRSDPRGGRTLDYIGQELRQELAPVSVAYAIMALTRQGRRPSDGDLRIERATRRVLAADSSPYKLALLALAANPEHSLLRPEPTLQRTAQVVGS